MKKIFLVLFVVALAASCKPKSVEQTAVKADSTVVVDSVKTTVVADTTTVTE